MQMLRAAGVARIPKVLLMGLALTLVPVSTASATGQRDCAAGSILIPSASWHGRPIKEPHRHDAVRTSVADAPLRGWSAGPVSFGTGYHRPDGSDRVREVQRRLRALGYQPGPIDGLFGPLTRASVAWFQVKHGLPVDGRATLATVRHLRARTGAGVSRSDEESVDVGPRSQEPGAVARTSGSPAANSDLARAGDGPPLGLPATFALLALLLAIALLLRRRRPARREPAPDGGERSGSTRIIGAAPASRDPVPGEDMRERSGV